MVDPSASLPVESSGSSGSSASDHGTPVGEHARLRPPFAGGGNHPTYRYSDVFNALDDENGSNDLGLQLHPSLVAARSSLAPRDASSSSSSDHPADLTASTSTMPPPHPPPPASSSAGHTQHSFSSADAYLTQAPPPAHASGSAESVPRHPLSPPIELAEGRSRSGSTSGGLRVQSSVPARPHSMGMLASPPSGLTSPKLQQAQPLQSGPYAPVPLDDSDRRPSLGRPVSYGGASYGFPSGPGTPSGSISGGHGGHFGMFHPPGTPGSPGTPGRASPGYDPDYGSYGRAHTPSNMSIGGSTIGRPSSRASGSVYGLMSNAGTMDASMRDAYLSGGPGGGGLASPGAYNDKMLPPSPGGHSGKWAGSHSSASYYASAADKLGSAQSAPGVARYAGLGDEHLRKKSRFGSGPPYSARKKALIIGGVALLLAVICVAVVVPVAEHFINKPNPNSQPGGIVEDNGKVVATTGGNGSVITLDDGTQYTYINPYGGTWNSGLLNNSAQAQSYTPPLDQPFYVGEPPQSGSGASRKRQSQGAFGKFLGVNLGGWLVTEPFIVPALYEPFANTSNPALDEFTLSTNWLSQGGQANLKAKMTQHYDTFITERDFADIACAGLNWVRLPIGFWAIETIEGEPFLEGVSWNYVLKAIQWARKYGLRINLDLHAVPGSANGFNHGGKLGPPPPNPAGIHFLQGPAGLANAQRTLKYLRQLAQFISQPDIAPVVPLLTIINEPYLPSAIGQPALSGWYAEVYSETRDNITGLGAGHGPILGLHDGFLGLASWEGYMPGADRLAWDIHPYIAFGPTYTNSFAQILPNFCNNYGPTMDRALSKNGMAFAGEWSPAANDCGLYLNGVNLGTRYENTYQGSGTVYGNCSDWTNWPAWNDTMKANIKAFAAVQMDALKNTFYWSWKIGNSSVTGKVESPVWSYSLGRQQGWLPDDPYHAGDGACSSVASQYSSSLAATTSWASTFSGWQVGQTNSPYTANPGAYAWPPTSISSAGVPITAMPSYTRTGSIAKLPVPTWTESQAGRPNPSFSNWAQNTDTAPMYVEIAGCSYMTDQYTVTAVPGTWPCSGTNAPSKRAPLPQPKPTPPPQPRA